MKYVSTRGQSPALSFEDTMLTGLAPDGGLYVPEDVPSLSHEQIAAMAGKSYQEVAFEVMKPFVGDTFTDEEFKGLITKAYAGFGHISRAPMTQLGDNHWMLELWHGPTLAFKDFAMQLIGQMFQHVLARRGERVTIVGATSGDTGSAAIEAFRGLDNVDVVILYPHGRVSEVQRRQHTKNQPSVPSHRNDRPGVVRVGRIHISVAIRRTRHSLISKIASTSTATPVGRAANPTALRA